LAGIVVPNVLTPTWTGERRLRRRLGPRFDSIWPGA